MAKSELGTKRLCPSCGTKYYDLNRNPATCPKCGALFEAVAAKAKPAAAADPEAADEEDGDEPAAEFVPLEVADEEEAEGVSDDDEDDQIDAEASEDDTFLEEEEDGDDDVTGIVREVGDEDDR